jgi:hypothetical protein
LETEFVDKTLSLAAVMTAAMVAVVLFMLGRREAKLQNCRHRRFWIEVAVVLAMLSFAVSGAAQDSSPPKDNPAASEKQISPELETQIKDLIAKLGSDDASVREIAALKLVEIGAPARRFLAEALESADAEVKARAGSILTGISVRLMERHKEFQKVRALWKQLTEIRDSRTWPKTGVDTAQADAALAAVTKETGLSAALKEALQLLITARASHMLRSYGATCYFAGPPPAARQKDDFEAQLKLLVAMHAEGKVAGDAFEKARESVRQELELFTVVRNEKDALLVDGLSPDETRGLLDAVVDLCVTGIEGKKKPEEEPRDHGTEEK